MLEINPIDKTLDKISVSRLEILKKRKQRILETIQKVKRIRQRSIEKFKSRGLGNQGKEGLLEEINSRYSGRIKFYSDNLLKVETEISLLDGQIIDQIGKVNDLFREIRTEHSKLSEYHESERYLDPLFRIRWIITNKELNEKLGRIDNKKTKMLFRLILLHRVQKIQKFPKELQENYKGRKREIYKEIWDSFSPWLEYFINEVYLDFEFKIYCLINILNLEEKRNGTWRTRTSNKTIFPKFNTDTVNRVLPILREILEEGSGEISDEDLTENELNEIVKTLNSKDKSEEEKFLEVFTMIDKLTEPEEYENLGEKYSVHFFRGNLLQDTTIGDRAKKVAELCRKSKSFCIRGEGMAREYLQDGDLYILTKEGTNKQTKENEKYIPQIAIYLQNGTINEIRGNEEGQDLSAHDAQFILDILEGKNKTLDEYQDLKNAIFRYFGQDLGSPDYTQLNNVLTIHTLKEKTENNIELDKEELKWIYGFSGSMDTFTEVTGENPVVKKIKNNRNKILDYCKIFNCKPVDLLEQNTGTVLYRDLHGKKVIVGNVLLDGEFGEQILLEDIRNLPDNLTIVGSLRIKARPQDRRDIEGILSKKKIKLLMSNDIDDKSRVRFID